MIKTILVPVDGSDTSAKAAATAVEIAKGCGAEINFLYVSNVNQLAINACLSEAVLDAVNKAGAEILDASMKLVPDGVKKQAFTETGSPTIVILEIAKKYNADMIVMGSRGLGVVKGVLLGSVSQYVVEQAACPVLVVK